MARFYITDMRLPHACWFWAVRHAAQVMDYLPVTVNGISTTLFELVNGTKLIIGSCFTSFLLASFAIPRMDRALRQSDRLLFYCPHNRQIYSTNDYKLDEGLSTPTLFSLQIIGFITGLDQLPCHDSVDIYKISDSLSQFT